MPKVILHADLNNFYASVACRDRPALWEQPVAVCGDPEKRHGIVLAKNMTAKKLGVKTGMVIWQAKQLCPHLVTIAPDYDEVLRASKQVRSIFERYTSHVQPYGIDEAWLDLSAANMTIRDGEHVANHLRHTVREETGLTVSVGVSDNRIFAKLGSDLKKPDAVSVVCAQNRAEVLDPLPVGELLFVGRATVQKLNTIGIYTVGQLAAMDPAVLQGVMGKTGLMLSGFARGDDAADILPTVAEPKCKSVGNSVTAAHDVETEQDARITLYVLSESVGARLRKQGLEGRVVQIWLRDVNLVSCTRQTTLEKPTDCSQEIFDHAYALYRRHWTTGAPLRSMGVSVSQVHEAGKAVQLSFLPQDVARQKQMALERAIDGIRERYGQQAVRRAVLLADRPLGDVDPSKTQPTPEPYFKSC